MSQLDFSAPSAKQYASLDELFAVMQRMTDDPLAKAGTNVVISRGNPNAKLLIVGEAPGPEENIKGKPFVGKAGQMLDKILQAANFDPETDVYITNSVFRLPPGDDGKSFRKPTDAETDFYRPFVLEIIRLIDPKIMLLTGNVASYSILRKTGITSLTDAGSCRSTIPHTCCGTPRVNLDRPKPKCGTTSAKSAGSMMSCWRNKLSPAGTC